MPRYKVVEKRALHNGVIIEARDEAAALDYKGEILDELESDSWSDSLVSIEQVEDDCEEVGDLP